MLEGWISAKAKVDDMIAALVPAAIFSAHVALAPSQIMPCSVASMLLTAHLTSGRLPPCR